MNQESGKLEPAAVGDELVPMFDPVNKPAHYNSHPSKVEAIEICEQLNFCVGNAVKYLFRAGLKGSHLEDLKKAEWYLRRERIRLDSGGYSHAPPWHREQRLAWREKVKSIQLVESDESLLRAILAELSAGAIEGNLDYHALERLLPVVRAQIDSFAAMEDAHSNVRTMIRNVRADEP